MKNKLVELSELQRQIQKLRGSAKTNNIEFDENGFLVIRKLFNPSKFIEIPSYKVGFKKYPSKTDKSLSIESTDVSCDITYERYNEPQFKQLSLKIKQVIENITEKKLYETYYYDRFYYSGSELYRHIDRSSCEISVSANISSNLKENWAFELESPLKGNLKIYLSPGDAILYKGCEVLHWRSEMKSNLNNLQKILGIKDTSYYHQIFFHYVMKDGLRSHYAYDDNKFAIDPMLLN